VQADAFNGHGYVGTVVDHELAFAGNGQLELTRQVDELSGGQVMVAQLDEVNATGDGILHELDDVAVLGV
jgi:hypothetical protein